MSTLQITSPEDYYYGPPASPKNVSVMIKNEGLLPQSGFDMKYVFNGIEVIENVGSLTLNANETYEFLFLKPSIFLFRDHIV